MRIIPNVFTQVEFNDDDEEQSAKTFNLLQLAHIRNTMASAAIQRSAIDFDVESPTAKIVDDAYLKGQIDILQYLIDTSESVSETITVEE